MSEWEKAKEKWGRQEIKLGYLMDRELIQAADKEIATRDAELARLREALERLASMEALTMTRAVVMPHDEELIARINFAEQALKSHDS